jgi:photosystem I P700 chlorophyll a apoprotein A1
VTVLVLLKGVLFARSSRLIPDKGELGFRFPCDGPGRGGTCQASAWDHVFLGLFWMYNSLSIVIFHFFWKMQSDVWGTVSSDGVISHITGGNFAQSSITNNGWLRISSGHRLPRPSAPTARPCRPMGCCSWRGTSSSASA